jgi:hypothetical protein
MSEQTAPVERASLLSLPLDGIRTVLQGLWACRVSLVSVAAGGYVLWNVPQAHDLFVELHTGDVGRTHWALFYASVLLFWILPVHLSARLMLEGHAAAHPAEFTSRGSRFVAAFPWLLSLLCIAAVAMALVAAKRNIPQVEPGSPEQVRHLLGAAHTQVDTLLLVTGALALAFLVVWFLIYPVLRRLTRRSGLLDTWLVRKVAELLFDRDRRLRAGVRLSADEQLDLTRTMTRRRQIAVAALLLFVLWMASWSFVIWRPVDVPTALRRAPLLPIVFGAWVPILTLPAYLATRWRLPLLALFVVGLTVFGAFGRDYHSVRLLQDKPSQQGLLSGVCFPDHRDMAPKSARTVPHEARQVGLERAIEMWRQANGCAYGSGACRKRPIIVAAEGGASRAAFFTSSVLGYLQDTSPAAPSGRSEFSQQLFAISSVSGSALGTAAFVAAMDHTGHTRAGPAETRPPLIGTAEKASDTLWFRNRIAAGSAPSQNVKFDSWVTPALKDPLQAILSGDFLTPVAAGLGLDVWWRLHCEDRATVIERAWEDRFAAFLPPDGKAVDKTPDRGAPDRGALDKGGRAPATDHGLARSLSSFAPTPERWRPLLIFNGSSVSTGRRIVTSTLHPLTSKQRTTRNAQGQPEYEPVFLDAYDFYDHLCRSSTASGAPACQCASPKTPNRTVKGCDIRLSTAVSNSARFPVITPQGDIRDPNGQVHDRIVDGGYFDNFGILSAIELATQIRTIDERQAKARGVSASADVLSPFILLVSNDPEFYPEACPAPRQAATTAERSKVNQARYSGIEDFEARAAPDPPADQGPVVFSMLRYPIDAALRSWTASARTARGRLDLLPSPAYGYGVVQVCPQYLAKDEVKRISMNWWLSMPVQAFLDSQVCATHNDVEFLAVAALIAGKTPSDPDWQAWNEQWSQLRILTCDRAARPKRNIEYAPRARSQK